MSPITASDITVLAPNFYQSDYNTRYLRASAARHDVPIHWYGTGEPYRGWLDVQITRLLAELRQLTTSHFLYTDSSDAIFLSDLSEIAAEYSWRCEPRELLMSVERDDRICAGGWMGNVQTAMGALEWIRPDPSARGEENPQELWRSIYTGAGTLVELDLSRSIFQVADEPQLEVQHVWDHPRIMNRRTGSLPAICHWAGGYTDPAVGKAALIEPTWRQLGYEATV